MVGPVSRGRLEWGTIIVAQALRTRGAAAADAEVVVSCPELSAEDAAQVEARVRASLLSAGLEPAAVELSCSADSSQTQVTGNGRQALVRSARSTIPIKEVLLASADSALSAWGGPTAGPTTGAPATASPPPPAPSATAPILPPAVLATPAAPSGPTPHPATPSVPNRTWASAGARTELWQHGSGLGAQLGLEHELPSAFLALQVGYLAAVPTSSRFSAREIPVGAQLGWRPRNALGFRAALGVGLSVFATTPAAGVSAQSGKTLTLPFLGVELSRSVELGAFALLPALGATAFSSSRTVKVDDEVVLTLPTLALSAGLALALKLGG
jgi:hypothetical protein